MSSIDKLSILGVRSFDNVHSETIAFHKPLTLIVGTNGSGKTTIIECLKYATTGELPPNAKVGGAFIHDPKLCGEKEILAQVKLGFRSSDGTKMICTRSLQLTVKKAARSMSQLEGNLLILRNAEKISLSQRAADLNGILPTYLGVSKAVLDSVIFCHQEDSLWPLSQPKDLKERFDAIFEAVKYTKAVDNIKVMQKKHKTDLEVMKKEEEHLKANKLRGKKIEQQAQKLSHECDELRKEHEDFGDRIKQAAQNAETAWRKAETAGMIVGQLEGKRIERRTKEESVQSLREHLKEMSDTDEELQRMVEQYDERVGQYQDDLDAQKKEYSNLGQEIHQGRSRVGAKERECGSYEAQAEQYERQVKNREKLVKETARSHSIRGFDLELDDEQVASFVDRISKLARDQNAAFERHRRENQELLQRDQDVLNQHHQTKSGIGGRKDSARQAIATNDRKINSLQSDLNRIKIDEGSKVTMESNLREAENRLQKAKSDLDASDWDQQAQATELELRKLDDRKEKLDAELVEGTRHAQGTARLDLVQKDLKDRERRLETNVGAHKQKISALVGGDWTPRTIELEFQHTIVQSAEQLAEAERQRDGTSREQEQVDFQLNTCRRDIKAKQQAMKKAADAIKQSCDCEPGEYNSYVNEMEQTRDNLKTDTEGFNRLFAYYDSCIKVAKGHGHKGQKTGCRTCGRGFKDNKEADHLVTLLNEERKKLEEQMGTAPEDLKGLEQDLEAAKAVSSDFETWERLKEKEVPALQREEAKLVKRRDHLIEQLERQDAVVNERQSAKRDIDVVARTVQGIATLHTEIEEHKAQIQELFAKQKSQGLARGLEQIQDDLKKLNDESRSVKARLSKVNTERERARAHTNSLELEVRDTRSKLSTAEYQLKERRTLESQVDELKTLTGEQRDNIKALDQQLHDLGPQISQAQAKYDETARVGAEKDRELQAAATKLNNSVSQLKIANQDIDAYISRGGPEQLNRCKSDVENLKKEVTRLEEEQTYVVRQVKQLEDQLRNHSETRRSISDNQRYRRDLRQLERVSNEIAELETHNAEEDKARYEDEGQRWQRQRNKLAADQATVIGSLKSKDETLVEMLKDYETEYKDSARKYKEAHIKVETTKACVEDLARFGGALDKAIMKYHSMKMEEINRIIEELWRKTYQGTDVDYILIRSESETVRANKSYNYRVCMVKQNAEMDMRGRCSAGQKVLASIIIRLALAECFGVNCGVMALDEPTTNLDRDNIKALAESLGEIIRFRRQQKNFQLIVITHDEEFLRYMGCSDFADVYYRVSRSAAQKSIIERQNIADVI